MTRNGVCIMDEEYVVKDHLQDVLLSAIYNSVEGGCVLVFKGGTSIRKIYGIDRYSDDLDFTLNTERLKTPADKFIYGLRDRCTAMLAPLYNTRMHIHKVRNEQYGIDISIADSMLRSAKIHIEIRVGRVYLPCAEKRVIAPDTTYFASVMGVDEIIAEKIRAVYTRRNVDNMARDVVDISFLMAHGGKFNPELADMKLEEVNHKHFSMSSFSKRLGIMTSKMWQRDLGKIMKSIPDRNETISHVMKSLHP